MRTPPRLALLASIAAAMFLGAGCNYVTPALWIAQGPPKKPAEFVLPKDKKLVVFVDDRHNVVSRLQLRSAIADDVSDFIRKEGLVKEVLSGRELIAYARKMETSTKRVSIQELGNAVNADLVLYIEMESFSLSPDGSVPRPMAEARLKVVDVKGKDRLFPPAGADPKGYPVSTQMDAYSPDSFRTSAARRAVEDALAKKFADQIAKTFYEYDPTNYGQGVTKFEG